MSFGKTIRSTSLLALVALLCGCSGLRLYSETRDKQGVALKTSYGDAKVETVIAVQRENNAALLQEQLKAQEQSSKSSRNEKIRALVTSTTGTIDSLLVTPLTNEVITLAGSEDALAQWQLNQRYDADYASSREDEAREFQRFGFELPFCADLQSGKASATLAGWISSRQGTTGGFLSETLQHAKFTCNNYKKGEAPLSEAMKAKGKIPLGGRLETAVAGVAGDEEELEKQRTNSLAARNAYRAALGEYDAATADANKGDPEARKKVEDLATKLKESFKLVSGASDAFGTQFLAQEKRDSLTAFLAAVAGTKSGENPPAGSSRAAMALILVPEIFDSARQSLAEAKKPLLVPLLMRKNYEQLNLEAANRDIAAQETIVALARARLTAMTEQAIAVKDALDTLKPIGSTTKNAKFSEVGKVQSVEERQRIFQALAIHFDAEGRLAAELKKYDYKRSAALQEQQLSLAEVNVLQWNSLIGTSIDQLADFGTTGIKAEHILAVINSLTLLWIGSGVN